MSYEHKTLRKYNTAKNFIRASDNVIIFEIEQRNKLRKKMSA